MLHITWTRNRHNIPGIRMSLLVRCLGKFLTCYFQLNTMYNYRNSNKTPFFCKKINKILLPIGLSAGQIGNSQVATLQRLAMREFRLSQADLHSLLSLKVFSHWYFHRKIEFYYFCKVPFETYLISLYLFHSYMNLLSEWF